jgi:S1-C subfamily serine protease
MPAKQLDSTQETIARLARDAGPSVVGLRGRSHGGSGVVVAPDRVLTLSRHVRREGVSVAFGDGREQDGRVLGVDHDLGIGLVEVSTGESPALSWADGADPPAIGTPVFALADPRGRGLRVTSGAVTSSPRSLRGPRGRLVDGLIEHTAPLPRGSGGGPLLDGAGAILGVNAVRVDDGLILALPGAEIRARLEDLAAGRRRSQRRLGVAIVPSRAARRLRRAVGLPERAGVLVRGVLPDSPAARATLERGDLIVAVDGKAVDSLDALFAALDTAPLDRPFTVSVVRGAQEQELEVSLEQS